MFVQKRITSFSFKCVGEKKNCFSSSFIRIPGCGLVSNNNNNACIETQIAWLGVTPCSNVLLLVTCVCSLPNLVSFGRWAVLLLRGRRRKRNRGSKHSSQPWHFSQALSLSLSLSLVKVHFIPGEEVGFFLAPLWIQKWEKIQSILCICLRMIRTTIIKAVYNFGPVTNNYKWHTLQKFGF